MFFLHAACRCRCCHCRRHQSFFHTNFFIKRKRSLSLSSSLFFYILQPSLSLSLSFLSIMSLPFSLYLVGTINITSTLLPISLSQKLIHSRTNNYLWIYASIYQFVHLPCDLYINLSMWPYIDRWTGSVGHFPRFKSQLYSGTCTIRDHSWMYQHRCQYVWHIINIKCPINVLHQRYRFIWHVKNVL